MADNKASPRRPRRQAVPPPTEERLVADEEHPDYVAGRLGEDGPNPSMLTPNPDGPTPPPFPPLPPDPPPFPSGPIPVPKLPLLPKLPDLPFRICGPVSGRYTKAPATPKPPLPILPPNLLQVTVRVDVDRYYPQHAISVEVVRAFPRARAHVIARVTSDSCLGFNRRRVVADIVFREDTAGLLPGTTITFDASRGAGFGYNNYQVTLTGAGITPVTHELRFDSPYFDRIEFEVDTVDNAGAATTAYDTGSHPNRPGGLPSEVLSLQTVYQRAGFETNMSPNTSVIAAAGAGANGTWDDSEMHNAMVTYWSRFAAMPQWAMWVLFARQHDMGPSLGGVMFDDIGPNHRQGTAIFTDSFIQNAPAGDPNQPAWRNRMVFWTAVHEIGHAFNLAHSWQKALGTPWIPLANEPEARSFMNYPFAVSGGQAAFFSDFAFRFSDTELFFMRHAPRRFVQMGNESWFTNHAFENDPPVPEGGGFELILRSNRAEDSYRFLEPVTMELKLTNRTDQSVEFDRDMLSDGRHLSLCVERAGGRARVWRPFVTRCARTPLDKLNPGESLYGAHVVSADTTGWLIDEPGFYKLQAAVEVEGQVVVSNVVRLWVQPPTGTEEGRLAGDYFTEDVGRAIVFAGAPALPGAMGVLAEVVARCGDNPAASVAAVALAAPGLRAYKRLEGDGRNLRVVSSPAETTTAAARIAEVLLADPAAAAETMGHIPYFGRLRDVTEAMDAAGNPKGATKLLQDTVQLMKDRQILPKVIAATERKLKAR